VRRRAAAAEAIDCLSVELLGHRVVTHERARPRLDAESPVRSRELRSFGEPLQRNRCDLVLATTCGRFDQLG
jgi:hypothetical protein